MICKAISAAAAAISVVHGLPLKHVLALRSGHGGMGIVLAELFAAALQALGGGPQALVFPGRNGLQPLTASAARHNVAGMTRSAGNRSMAPASAHPALPGNRETCQTS